MRRRAPRAFLLVVCFLVALVLLVAAAACTGNDDTSSFSPGSAPDPSGSPPRGVALNPVSNDEEGIATFLDRADEAGSLLAQYGDWADLEGDGGPFEFVTVAGRARGLEPVVAVSPFDQGTGELFRPLTDDTIAGYSESAVAFVARTRPRYFGIGIESNLLASKNPDTFEEFVTLFAEVAPLVKEASPDTQVFTSFELEWMAGYRAGAFGGRNDPATAQWDLLERFPDADILAFSSYPSLAFETPAEIPDDFYVSLRDHTDRPVAIAESGWAAESVVPGWSSSEAAQAEFAERLIEEMDAVDAVFGIWTLVYPAGGEVFDTMSLRLADDTPRAVWDVWSAGSD